MHCRPSKGLFCTSAYRRPPSGGVRKPAHERPIMTPDEKKHDSGNARAVTRFVLGYLGRDALRVSGFVAGMFAHVVLTVASTRLIGIAVEHAGRDTGLGRLGLDL